MKKCLPIALIICLAAAGSAQAQNYISEDSLQKLSDNPALLKGKGPLLPGATYTTINVLTLLWPSINIHTGHLVSNRRAIEFMLGFTYNDANVFEADYGSTHRLRAGFDYKFYFANTQSLNNMGWYAGPYAKAVGFRARGNNYDDYYIPGYDDDLTKPRWFGKGGLGFIVGTTRVSPNRRFIIDTYIGAGRMVVIETPGINWEQYTNAPESWDFRFGVNLGMVWDPNKSRNRVAPQYAE